MCIVSDCDRYSLPNNLYSLSNIVRMVKSRRMRGEVACGAYGGGERCAQGSSGET